jgi:hypothetical protein
MDSESNPTGVLARRGPLTRLDGILLDQPVESGPVKELEGLLLPGEECENLSTGGLDHLLQFAPGKSTLHDEAGGEIHQSAEVAKPVLFLPDFFIAGGSSGLGCHVVSPQAV